MIAAALALHWIATASPAQLVGLALSGGGALFIWFVISNTNDLMSDL